MVRIRSNEFGECPICLGDVKFAVETNCGHIFCGACIIELWRNTNRLDSMNCPLCRRAVTLLLPYFTMEETTTTRESEVQERARIHDKIHQFNRLQANESPNLWNQCWDLPVLLRHIWAELFTAEGLAFMSKMRIMILFFIGFIYVIVPIDLIPEAILGVFGLVDDFFVTMFVLIQAGIIYRAHVSN